MKATGFPCSPAAVNGVTTYATAVTSTNPPSTRRIGSRPRHIANTPTASIPARVSGQSVPNDSCRPGGTSAPHVGVVPVVEHREVGPQMEVAHGSGQRDRAHRADVGDRVADRDQVSGVPVAAAAEHHGIPHGAAVRRRVVRDAITTTPTVSAATGARNESLVPAARPAAIPATSERAGLDRASADRRPGGPASAGREIARHVCRRFARGAAAGPSPSGG